LRLKADGCPYSKVARGNIEVKLLANGKPIGGG
jgi:organic hydroperoxide reductase OsmC/OhrA